MVGLVKRTRRAVGRATSAGVRALVDSTPIWAREPLAPFAAFADMLVRDHGIFRVFYLNQHRASDKVWRPAQPAPYQIAALCRLGLRTIVNLRGKNPSSSIWPEAPACKRKRITIVNYGQGSCSAPRCAELRGGGEVIESI